MLFLLLSFELLLLLLLLLLLFLLLLLLLLYAHVRTVFLQEDGETATTGTAEPGS